MSLPDDIEPAAIDDRAGISALLREANLPVPTGEDPPVRMLVRRQGSELVGCVGWELHGGVALLRSLAVKAELRGQGLGRALVHAALGELFGLDVYLLTTDATGFFEHLGFQRIDRSALPKALGASRQLGMGCCATATAMRRCFS